MAEKKSYQYLSLHLMLIYKRSLQPLNDWRRRWKREKVIPRIIILQSR